jgi:hypothetical protein
VAGIEVYKVPLGYIQLIPDGNKAYVVALLQYTDADLEDPDNAVEAIMSAKPEPLTLRITGEDYTHSGGYQAIAWTISSNGFYISKHPDHLAMVRALLALSPLDWMAVETL